MQTAHTHQSTPLLQRGNAGFLGIGADNSLYIDVLSVDDWAAWYQISADGRILTHCDEQNGTWRNPPSDLQPIPQPTLPKWLNFSMGRERGLRDVEHLLEAVQLIPIADKLALLAHLKLTIPPMLLFGINESRVLSAAILDARHYLICRRLRFAYGLTQALTSADGLPYDYNTMTLHLAQTYDIEQDTFSAFSAALQGWGGQQLIEPTECFVQHGRLYLLDNNPPQECIFHSWHLA